MAFGLLALAGGALAGGLGATAMMDASGRHKYQTAEQIPDPSPYGISQMGAVQELLRRHNAGELDLPDEQVKQLSNMAAQLGMEFKVESKPISKMLFDLGDTALFGMLPDEWRPYSIGEELHGEPLLDRTLGGVGTLGGGLLSGGLILKGGKMALGGLKGWMGKSSAASGAQRSWNFANQQGGGLMNMPALNPVMGPGGSFIMG